MATVAGDQVHRCTGTSSLLEGDGERNCLLVDHAVNEILQYRMDLVRTVRKAGFNVHVAVPREGGLDAISRLVPTHGFHLRRTSTNPIDEMRCCISLLQLYRRLRPVLVHHIGLKPTLYGGIAARLAGVPAVVNTLTGLGYLFTTNTVKTRFLRSIVARGLQFSFRHEKSCAIFQNPDDRDRTLARGERAVVIRGSGVNLSLFAPEPEPEGPPMVLMASRLLWEKGVGDFVAAARALRRQGIQVRFVLLGKPDLDHPSAIPLSILRRWHDAGDVDYLGWRDDMPALIAQSHIVCLPSSYGEGVPRILLEAAASGRPIVATDAPGCREIVRDGENGLLIPAGNIEALVGAIKRLVVDAGLRATMGKRGREIAVHEFSLEHVLDTTCAVYRSLCVSNPTT